MMHLRVFYGFPGSDVDPRWFAPDREECRPEEIAAWEEAVAKANRGEAWDDPHPPMDELALADGTVIPAGSWYTGSKWGIGTITYPARETEPAP